MPSTFTTTDLTIKENLFIIKKMVCADFDGTQSNNVIAYKIHNIGTIRKILIMFSKCQDPYTFGSLRLLPS